MINHIIYFTLFAYTYIYMYIIYVQNIKHLIYIFIKITLHRMMNVDEKQILPGT